ncbi:MAG: rRNA maturation RNase YbeY [Candidatus Moraniibacteriota bacterium]
MKLNLEINNATKSPVKKAFIQRVVLEALEKSRCDFLREKTISLSFAWITEAEIRAINKTYRGKDRATDVLSFCEYADTPSLKKAPEKELFLGELLLCYNYIKTVAEASGQEKSLQKELARIIAHGVLHLLGFLHGKKMFDIQDAISEDF